MLTRRPMILFASGLLGAVLLVAVGWIVCLRRGVADAIELTGFEASDVHDELVRLGVVK